ncbi:putative ATP-dependent DNA helicase domain protein [Mycobacterium xenopi 3993]|nr:putative ATP-dependent DNA helicase domain protein [Mycobacterium xenopi 3993]
MANELTVLRGHLAHPLPDLVAEVRRVLGVDCEARAAQPVHGGWAGAEHLDAFTDVVNGYAERATTSPPSARLRWPPAGLLGHGGGRRKRVTAPQLSVAPTGSKCSRCMRQRGWSGRWWRCRTCRPGCSVHRVDSHLAHRRRRPAAVAAGRPRVGGPARCPCLGHLGSRQPKTAV